MTGGIIDLQSCHHGLRLPTNTVLTSLLLLLPVSYELQTRHLLKHPTDTACSIWHVFLHSVYSSLQLAVVISQHISGGPVFGCTDFAAERVGTPRELWTFWLGLALVGVQWFGAGVWCYNHIRLEFTRDTDVTMDHIVEQLSARKTFKTKWLSTLLTLFLITLMLPLFAFFVLTPWAPLLVFVPLAGFIGVAQTIPEIISMRQNRNAGGLSRPFLQIQVVLFLVLAVGWGLSAGPYEPVEMEDRWGNEGMQWYFGGGGVAVNWGIHALSQGILLGLGYWYERQEGRVRLEETRAEEGERNLLRRHEEAEE